MEEGTNKAIPLRRSRNGARTVAVRPARRWSDSLGDAIWRALSPPRQIWLAGLGGAALTLKGARTAWDRLVAEGATAEGWLRRTVGTPDT